MLDRQRIRREDAVRVEDVIPEEILNDTRVDREYLEQVFREPQKFVPARTREEPSPRPEPEEEPESRTARRAKLAGLVAAGLLVAGAVVTAGVLAGTQRQDSVSGAAATEVMSGAAALGGLAVPDATEPQRKQETPTPSGTSTKAQPSSGTGSGSGTRQGSTSSSTSSQPAAKPAVGTAEGKIDAVRKFYQTVDADPYGAMSLLTPVLADSEAGRLIQAWSSMDAIQIQDIREQADGTILAVVTMRNPDGALVRVTQVLEFADETTGLITDARLLSAQHM
ncbi:hypothetical protein ACFQ05_16520 [Amycolatopsis umgeniensis]|uniref:Uncharacterized protein n=1 Tax=Amycolatopsis umgeniensis TaxID=336628 RepID=A0A841B8T2_9PSEU|nr:hypothetical protein [Amycolatopsis umgeniensis]MBB5854914.1 hypothetical protein [Amycolatopsis umgeniensis]